MKNQIFLIMLMASILLVYLASCTSSPRQSKNEKLDQLYAVMNTKPMKVFVNKSTGFKHYYVYMEKPFYDEAQIGGYGKTFFSELNEAGCISFYDDSTCADLCTVDGLTGELYVKKAEHLVGVYYSDDSLVSLYPLVDKQYYDFGGKKEFEGIHSFLQK